MKYHLHPVDGKESRCCYSIVCTCVDVVQHESTRTSLLAVLTPGLEDLRQAVVHVAVSTDTAPA